LLQSPPNDERWERSLPSWEGVPSFSAWDGDACVGHASTFLVDTTVPGGARLSTSAVTLVGVLPTHRRLRIGTRLMEALIDDAQQRGLVLASLRASEAVIYRRYGFGVAGEYAAVRIDPARVDPVRGANANGSFRMLEPTEILDIVEPLYERVAHSRPGRMVRPPAWSERYLRAAIERTEPSFVVVHRDAAGQPDGYVHYNVKWSEGAPQMPAGEGELHDLFGASDEVELALWQYLFDLDLVSSWQASERPVDDLVKLAARDPRGYQQISIEDEQWLRLVDADAALRGRSYNQASGSVVIKLADPLVQANNGSWRIDASGAQRTDDAPDLSVGIETLSAAYLGGPSWAALAGTGVVEVTSSEALATADTLFASRPLPHCGSFF
jgi:predicted acetyltransferase